MTQYIGKAVDEGVKFKLALSHMSNEVTASDVSLGSGVASSSESKCKFRLAASSETVPDITGGFEAISIILIRFRLLVSVTEHLENALHHFAIMSICAIMHNLMNCIP